MFANTCTAIVQGHQNKTAGYPHNPELIQGNNIRRVEQHYSEQQNPSSQQPVHLKMAS
jgi:hypothetical protein